VNYLFFDFETYYCSKTYTLKKMTPVEYILDPRWETIGCSFIEGLDPTQKAFWIEGPDLPRFFAGLDPANTCTVSFNSLFDNCILAWRYGFVPKLMIDMLGVCRAMLGHRLRSLSLANVSEYMGIGAKGGTVHKVDGMGLEAIKAAGLYEEYKSYSMQDSYLLRGIFNQLVLSGLFPKPELVILDMVLRCAVEPMFQLDQNLLCEHLAEVRAKKAALMAQVQDAGITKSTLMSNEKFAELLRTHGVEPPTKTSPVTGEVTYAFSKKDEEFLDLENHEDPMVQAIVAARLGTKSTLEESRTEALIRISNLQWPDIWVARQALLGRPTERLMPVPLKYSGAHTHRLSGDWKINEQNLPKVRGDGTGGKLRKAHVAPPGYKVVAVDASQIEARLNATVSGQEDLIAAFGRGADVYSEFATDVFGRPVNKHDNPDDRFVGKQAVLGLGYQLGWIKFQRSIKTDSKNQLGKMLVLSDEEALNVVNTYRRKNDKIKAAWGVLRDAIEHLARGEPFAFGPCSFEKGSILLPSGLRLHYHDLTQKEGDKGPQWWFTFGGKPKKLYGGKLLENIIQALARIAVMEAAVRIRKRLLKANIHMAMQVHDELVYVVREQLASVVLKICEEEMSRRPDWLPNAPLKAEGGIGATYGDAK
jgi:hypothetical protein